MKRPLQLISCLSFTLFLNFELMSQTLAGGEIYYELIGSKKYKITAHLYRMCESSSLNGINANVYGDTVIRAMHFKRIAISKINDTCNNPCNKQNAASNPGFEKHTYVDTIDFNVAPYDVFVSKQICVVNFGIRMAARYAKPTTHDTGQFYIDASTNICLTHIIKNTSPQFSMEPKLKAGCNNQIIYSPGPLDSTDNDSFVFTLANLQSNYKVNIAYKGSLTPQIPMSPFCLPPGTVNCKPLPNAKPPRGFYFDDRNCMTIFTPNNCNEIGTIKYKIDEYRFNKQSNKYEWLGYIIREMLVQILKIPDNNPPTIAGNLTASICQGDKLCFTRISRDNPSVGQVKPDSTKIFWDYGIKDATFRIKDTTAREKEAEFCWQSIKKPNQRLEKNFFTIGTYDRKCNLNLTSYTQTIATSPAPKFTYNHGLVSCGQVNWSVTIYDSLYPQNVGSCYTVIKPLSINKILFSSRVLTGGAILNYNGKIVIEHYISATSNIGCPTLVIDTLTISNAIELPSINDNLDHEVCLGSTVSFKTLPSQVTSFNQLKWIHNGSVQNNRDSIIQIKMDSAIYLYLQVINSSGCKAERSVDYTIRQHKAISTNNNSYCLGQMVNIMANTVGLQRPLQYKWSINGIDTSVVDSAFSIVIDKDKKVSITLSDADNCAFKDSVFNLLYINSKLKLVSVDKVCRDSVANVHAADINQSKNYTYHWKLNGKDTVNNDSVLNFKATKDSKVILKILYQAGCSITDSISILAIPTPQVSIPYSPYKCSGSLITLQPTISNRPDTINYLWTINKAIINRDSQIGRIFNSTTTVKVKVSNNLGCSTEDTANVFVYPLSNLNINSKLTYHPSSFIILKTTNTFYSYLWFNGKKTASDSFWASDLGAPGKYKVWCEAKDQYGCSYDDTIEINTAAFLDIQSVNFSIVKIYPNPASTQLTIELPEDGEVILYTVEGKLLLSFLLKKGVGKMDVSGLASGVYLLKIKMNGEEKTLRILKQ